MSNIITKLFNKISSKFSKSNSTSEKMKYAQSLHAQNNNNERLKSHSPEQGIPEINSKYETISPKQLIAGMSIDVGRQRKNNEDSLFSLSTVIDSNGTSTAFGIYIVADGMGGHNNGEVASEIAVRTVSHHLMNTLYPAIYSPNPQAPNQSLQEILTTGFALANEKIINQANGGGTTLTAVLTIGSQMTIAHVGDSRAYSIYLDGKITPLTRDHSFVSHLVEMGQITEEEALVHPQKSTLINAVGQKNNPQPDIFNARFPEPGFLMICSDGLWGVLSEEVMFSIIKSAPTPQRACQNLVDAANAAGGPDNIAVILVKLSD